MAEQPLRIQNLFELVGDSKAARRQTVGNHFNAFWRKYKETFRQFIPDCDVLGGLHDFQEEIVKKHCKEIFGYVADYMHSDIKLKRQSNIGSVQDVCLFIYYNNWKKVCVQCNRFLYVVIST